MKFNFKVVFEDCFCEKHFSYYESTSISALISYLSDNGCAVGFIVEIKRVSRLPKNVLPFKGYYE